MQGLALVVVISIAAGKISAIVADTHAPVTSCRERGWEIEGVAVAEFAVELGRRAEAYTAVNWC